MPAASSEAKELSAPRALLARFLPFQRCRHVAVAVSGGSDSMALMHLVADWRAERGDAAPRVTVLTVDHGLRPEAAAEARQVAERARARGLAHQTLAWEGDKPRTGLQQAARRARYRLMSDWCVANGAEPLAVAHTLDDQAETMLMRLARGSGLDGLAAMAPVSLYSGIAVHRPLLDVGRDELRAFLRAGGHAWIDDPCNEDDRFERVRVRKALPALEALGITVASLARSAARLQRARQALEADVDEIMPACVESDPAGWCRIDAERFAGLQDELRLRVLARCLQAVGGTRRAPAGAALERLVERMGRDGFRAGTLAGCRVSRRGATFAVVREPARLSEAPMTLRPGSARIWDGRFRVALGAEGAPARDVRLELRPLGARGWELVKDEAASCPPGVREGLVSVWCADRLVAVPHLGFRSETACPELQITAEFCTATLLGATPKAVGAPSINANRGSFT